MEQLPGAGAKSSIGFNGMDMFRWALLIPVEGVPEHSRRAQYRLRSIRARGCSTEVFEMKNAKSGFCLTARKYDYDNQAV
jgi:hypothetical protein